MTDSKKTSPRRSTLQKVLQSAPARLVLDVFVVFTAYAVSIFLLGEFGEPFFSRLGITETIVFVIAIIPAYIAYFFSARGIERRTVSELSLRSSPKEFLSGLLVGFCLCTTVVLILWWMGYYRIREVTPRSEIVPIVPMILAAGFMEELLFRGILFRIVEEKMGSWIGLVISGALFGLGHIPHGHATVLSGVAIAVSAGVLLAVAYMVTGRLWLPIGIHIAWNFSQGNIFSLPISGTAVHGFVEGDLIGPTFLTGGPFGLEGSLLTVGACLLLSGYLLRRAVRAGKLKKPFWCRSGAI